eukprot:gene9451-1657_t
MHSLCLFLLSLFFLSSKSLFTETRTFTDSTCTTTHSTTYVSQTSCGTNTTCIFNSESNVYESKTCVSSRPIVPLGKGTVFTQFSDSSCTLNPVSVYTTPCGSSAITINATIANKIASCYKSNYGPDTAPGDGIFLFTNYTLCETPSLRTIPSTHTTINTCYQLSDGTYVKIEQCGNDSTVMYAFFGFSPYLAGIICFGLLGALCCCGILPFWCLTYGTFKILQKKFWRIKTPCPHKECLKCGHSCHRMSTCYEKIGETQHWVRTTTFSDGTVEKSHSYITPRCSCRFCECSKKAYLSYCGYRAIFVSMQLSFCFLMTCAFFLIAIVFNLIGPRISSIPRDSLTLFPLLTYSWGIWVLSLAVFCCCCCLGCCSVIMRRFFSVCCIDPILPEF